jgi:hypothetical protein
MGEMRCDVIGGEHTLCCARPMLRDASPLPCAFGARRRIAPGLHSRLLWPAFGLGPYRPIGLVETGVARRVNLKESYNFVVGRIRKRCTRPSDRQRLGQKRGTPPELVPRTL